MAVSGNPEKTINKHKTQIIAVYSGTVLLTLHKTTRWKELFSHETQFTQLKGNNKENVGQIIVQNKQMQHKHLYMYKAGIFTRLSSLFATMEAKRLSPASSEMRKMYSGAVTWLDRWVRPGRTRIQTLRQIKKMNSFIFSQKLWN